MDAVQLSKMFDLLTECHNNRIEISVSNDELIIKYPKESELDKNLLINIKTSKTQLIEYLQSCENEIDQHPISSLEIAPLKYNGVSYYQITSTEIYWLDDEIDKDFKEKDNVHGSCYLRYDVRGSLNLTLFKKALSDLIKRHESLRSTFHYLNGQYLMKIEDENSYLYAPEIMDFEKQILKTDEINAFSRFTGHKLNYSKGPLLLVRIIRMHNEAFILSFKFHHVINDSFSQEIIIRDLFINYATLLGKTVACLPSLKYQLKEYLAKRREYNNINCERHRRYWYSLYPELPKELTVPIPIKCSRSLSEQILKAEKFDIPNADLNALDILSGKFSTSLFIILQAAFNGFMYHKTQQTDITIGTYIFGRDLMGAEDQIGCFAKTVLIRTIFDGAKTFAQILSHVKKSNEDMKTYSAFSLKDAFSEMLSEKESMFGTFWKINLQFNSVIKDSLDKVSFNQVFNRLGLQIIPITDVMNSHIQIDMHLQFLRSPRGLELVVHYDGSLYEQLAIKQFISEYLIHLRKVIENT